MDSMLNAIRKFAGLDHRCQWLAECQGVNFYNDSKGTNVGATLAALKGLAKHTGKIVLIAGGVGKGADFSALKAPLEKARGLVLIGEDAQKIADAVGGSVATLFAENMLDAVKKATDLAQTGDDVVLSPACASFDMFKGFEDRGRAFELAVKEVLAC
jgi:UDP-N-acetylmuramoylalanine--D-glutamate ligase